MRRVRIESDGTPQGTKVVDADTGEDIGLMMTSISWSIAAMDEAAIARIELPVAGVQVVGVLAEQEADDGADR